jgi:hypothetical protein
LLNGQFPLFSSKYVYFKIHDSNVAYIQNLQEGKRHQIKRDIKLLSFQSCVVTTNQHLTAFVFVPSVFGEKFPTAEIWMTSAQTQEGKQPNF